MSVKLADLLDLEDGEGVEVVGILRAERHTGEHLIFDFCCGPCTPDLF